MRLHKLSIKGFRRIKDASILFGDSTFLIGENNSGKSSVLKAIDYLLSDRKQLTSEEYYSERDPETGETKVIKSQIILEAEFRDLPPEAKEWRGFKGRLFEYAPNENSDESGLCIYYRKTYELGKDVVVELKSKNRILKEKYKKCKKPQDFINAGVDEASMKELFPNIEKSITEKEKLNLEAIDAIWDIESGETWFQNPGGIPGNILTKLPSFLMIPADLSAFEIQDAKNGVLGKTLCELFDDVRSASDNYKEAQKYLNKLAIELDPNDRESEFGKMMCELNSVLTSIFPESQLHAITDLSDPDKTLKPAFEIRMSSNIQTPIEHQGTGMIRSAVFGLLRFRQKWQQRRENQGQKGIIVGFEEPEIYLHPSAANQMRDTIYQLSDSKMQMVATTHSPYLIDISRKPRQVLNRFRFDDSHSEIVPFSVTDEYEQLQGDDKNYVKMLLKIDDYIARAFFAKKVLIVEGDTEDISIRESLALLPDAKRLKVRSNIEVIKARGKASIISLVKYFKALNVNVFVIHDSDQGNSKAEQFNQPIKNAVNNDDAIIVLDRCIEDILGYEPPSNDKPYRAFKESLKWEKWDNIPERLREVLTKAFSPFLDDV